MLVVGEENGYEMGIDGVNIWWDQEEIAGKEKHLGGDTGRNKTGK